MRQANIFMCKPPSQAVELNSSRLMQALIKKITNNFLKSENNMAVADENCSSELCTQE